MLAASDADLDSLPARLADRAICIGPGRPAESYLKVDTIVQAALGVKADAIHPGYGFLSERPRSPELCEQEGVIFIGPTAAQIEAVGDKLRARAEAEAAGVPTAPGGAVENVSDAMELGREIGPPLLVKAVGGGGGRGMKRVDRLEDLPAAMSMAAAEAGAAFGDARVYLERFVARGRHVEVQVLGDGAGRRDSSRRARLLGAAALSEADRGNAGSGPFGGLSRDASMRRPCDLRSGSSYRGAGTVEFLVDLERDAFYFLEMNARIQVEHPITEAVTGVDLVAEQIAIADGRGLRFKQDDIRRERLRHRMPDQRRRSGARFSPQPGHGAERRSGPQAKACAWIRISSPARASRRSMIR